MGDLSLKLTSPFYEYRSNNGPWFVVSFVVFSCCLSALGYFSEYKAKEDILTPIRKMLVGTWKVRFESWILEDGKIRKSSTQDVCIINIDNISAKLYMNFTINNSDIFCDTEFDITNVNIQFQTEPKKLIYFHEIDLQLKEPAQFSRTEPKLTMPILGVLEFRVIDDKVNGMSGYWYDVNNTIWHLLGPSKLFGSETIDAALAKGATTFRGALRFDRVQQD